MGDETDHGEFVDAWLRRSCADVAVERCLALLDAGMRDVWLSARETLGVVTLVAIAERVLALTSARYASLSAVTVDPSTGPSFAALPGDASGTAAARAVLVELLTVIADLTADVLTRQLRAALSAATVPEAKEP